jgi:Domain of unknown function (DUF4333)
MTQQIDEPRFAPQPPFPPAQPPHPPAGGYDQPPAAPYGQPPAAPYGPPPFGPPPGGFGTLPPTAPRTRTGVIVGSIAAALVVIGGLAVGALLLFGRTTIDTAEVERQIAGLTEEQVGVAAQDVRCPEDVEAVAGESFTCTATLEDQPVSFTVEQTDDEGNVQVTGDNQFVVLADVEAALAQQLGEQAQVEASASCAADGRTVLVDAAGTPVDCTVTNATDATDSVDVVATVDAAGTVSYVLS